MTCYEGEVGAVSLLSPGVSEYYRANDVGSVSIAFEASDFDRQSFQGNKATILTVARISFESEASH